MEGDGRATAALEWHAALITLRMDLAADLAELVPAARRPDDPARRITDEEIEAWSQY